MSPTKPTSAWRSFIRDELKSPVIVFLIALAVRLLYLASVRHSPLFDVLLIDSETYDRFASLILKGEFRGEQIYSMNILYPYVLALIYEVLGHSWFGVAVIQSVIDAVTCGLTERIGTRAFERPVGMIAGLLAVLYGPFVFYTGTLLVPTVINFLLTLCLYLLVLQAGRPSLWLGGLAGLVLGLATLGRGNSLLLVPLVLISLRLVYRSWRRAAAAWAVMLAGFAVAPVAATVRNYLQEKEFVPLSANYAAFYIGHNEQATGLYRLPKFVGSARYESEVLEVQKAVSELVGRPLSLAETSSYLLGEGLKFIREHPLADLKLTWRKFYFFWNTTESPTNLNYYFARDFSPVLRALPLSFGIIAPLGLTGLVLRRKAWRTYLLLVMFAAVPLLTCLVFFVSAEYRLPAAGVLIILAAAALKDYYLWGRGWLRGKPWQRLRAEARKIAGASRRPRPTSGRDFLTGNLIIAISLFVLVPLLIFCNWRSPLMKLQSLKRVDYLNFGVLYIDRQEYGKARDMLEHSLRIDSRYGPAYEQMARLCQATGDPQQVQHYLELAQRFRAGGQYDQGQAGPGPHAAEMARALQLYQQGEYAAALASFEQLYRLTAAAGDSSLALRTLNNVGLCHYKMKAYDEAERAFLQVIAEWPDYVFAYRNLARVYRAQGRQDEATKLMRQAEEVGRKQGQSRQ
jgi:Tfp pilus assembly protein PilF